MHDYNGFLKTKSGKGVKKTREDLEKIITYNESALGGSDKEVNISTSEFVILFLKNGYKAVEDDVITYSEKTGKPNKPHTQYRFEKEDNKIVVEKSAFEYYKFLIDNNVLDDSNEIYNSSNISENIEQDNMAKKENKSVSELVDQQTNKIEVIDNDKETKTKNADESQDDKDKKINSDTDKMDNTINYNHSQDKSKDKNSFEIWLLKETELYPDNDSVNLLKEIFEKENGVYDSKTKELLVLIENFDDTLCKERLIEKLWSGNTANRKVFEHITGLELPITNLDLKKYFQFLTKFDFKGRKKYIPISKNNHQQEKEFYIKSKSGKGFDKVKGYDYSVDGLNLFIRYSDTEVIISDVKTGVQMTKGTNEKEAKDKLKSVIDEKSIEVIKEMLEKREINPIYANASKDDSKENYSDEIDYEDDTSNDIDDNNEDEEDNNY